ncbi:MAG: dTDP-4-amino-4,6-dideoxygalactose transaminase [Bryobacterales bacterium]|nr:dTDP-4-amino-4,6-dideoxygalactose transaminase [Bryobacterales bacterium]
MGDYRIVFNNPSLVGHELTYMADAIHRGHSAGNGIYTKKCQDLLERKLGSPKVLLTTSCTDALELSALLLDIKSGDEIILPSFTFVSTANAFVLRGAKPVFVDIRPDTLNLDADLLSSAITSNTKAVVPVHYAGVGCEMDRICSLADNYSLAVVEDNAHGLFSRYRNKYLGTFGCCATQSFHESKNVICGEGGALVLNDPTLMERAEILRQKGTDRSRFDRGQVDKYTWVDIGSSFLPSDVIAAFLFAQLERYENIQAKRKKIWDTYFDQLSSWAEEHQVQLPHIPDYCEQSYHMFYMIMPSAELRDAMIRHLKASGIMAVFHYVPLHESQMGQRLAPNSVCPVTSRVSSCLVRLPFYNDLSESDQSEVVNAIQCFDGWKGYQGWTARAARMTP